MLKKNFFRELNLCYFLITVFGIGILPFSGTIATIIASLIWIFLCSISFFEQSLIILILFLLGSFLSNQFFKITKIHDHKNIVLDEFVGTWIVLTTLYENITEKFLLIFLFRFFDILKPWPINLVDKKVTNGFGVMLDDVLSAFLAKLIFHLIKLTIID
ncbi:hypothetical protein AOE58_00640 [Candidatus Riesia pthiripubis]|uniref:Phosphatidylglycerophosphatase A n=1 Tax=Candidatus Riesia pthiripubis TaxID=428412 RepID=A0A1V0HP54_9ENTR|nr:hypothetical protein AOE58_00640 [Candidatus Riesia pthiripubis]